MADNYQTTAGFLTINNDSVVTTAWPVDLPNTRQQSLFPPEWQPLTTDRLPTFDEVMLALMGTGATEIQFRGDRGAGEWDARCTLFTPGGLKLDFAVAGMGSAVLVLRELHHIVQLYMVSKQLSGPT